jgi:hypothetical protein
MLLEFRVRNFRSIRDEQALNLIASGDKELAATHLASTGLKSAPHALRTVVVYGPNASGKSSLLRALDYMRAVVAESATVIQPGQTYNVQPFKLDPATAHQPTEFEITFLLSGVRHQYAFAMTPQRIVSESLLVYRSSKPTQLFSRQHIDGDGDDYEFSTYLTGPRKLWQESTRRTPCSCPWPPSSTVNSSARCSTGSSATSRSCRLVPPFCLTSPRRCWRRSKAGLDPRVLSAADISIADVQAVPARACRPSG